MYWPELKEEIARLLPRLKNLERLHVDITITDRSFSALQFLVESMPESYPILEMTDIHSSADACSKVVDLIAAAPGIKPKELVIYGIEAVYVGWLEGLISKKRDIPFEAHRLLIWTRCPWV